MDDKTLKNADEKSAPDNKPQENTSAPPEAIIIDSDDTLLSVFDRNIKPGK